MADARTTTSITRSAPGVYRRADDRRRDERRRSASPTKPAAAAATQPATTTNSDAAVAVSVASPATTTTYRKKSPSPSPIASPTTVSKHIIRPTQPSSNLIRLLPTEILVRILSYLTTHELAQSTSVCREWYYLASDPLLWRSLDLSALSSKVFNPSTATSLISRLRTCRSFTLCSPTNLSQDHTTALLHFLSAAPMLSHLQLQTVPLLPHFLESHFRRSQTRCLVHVDLSHSPVTTPAIVMLMKQHHATLKYLDISHSAVADGTLRAVSDAKVLETLNISGCNRISRTSLRNFLCKKFPGCIENLIMQGLGEVKVTWLNELVKLPASGKLGVLRVEGCERLVLGEVRELQERLKMEGRSLEIVTDAKEEGAGVWAYRRYIEFLGTDPSLGERLGGEDGEKATEGKEAESSGGDKRPATSSSYKSSASSSSSSSSSSSTSSASTSASSEDSKGKAPATIS